MRGEASSAEKLDRARVLARLQTFIHQLDAILPYLSLAVSAVGLLNSGVLQAACASPAAMQRWP